ncbi:MAG: methyltransferase, partial [Thermohalobaculum sp.]|nr:methyltransferase [Thermohalobaculum sp.]
MTAAGFGALTEDRLLGGRVRLLQPGAGYRAATDPVLLAAAVPARPGERVLELGIGAGAATLCLAARVAGLVHAGLEIQPDYLALAARNAALNGVALVLFEGDVAAPPAA